MHSEVVREPEIHDQEKAVQNHAKNGFDLKNVVVTHVSSPNHHEQFNSVENHQKLFTDSCDLLRSEKSPSFDSVAEHHCLENEMRCNEEKVFECQTTLLEKSANDPVELYENESTKNCDADDEEIQLLNGIANICLTRETSCQNEKTNNVSSKDAKDKLQQEKPKGKSMKKSILIITDVFLSTAVVTPLVVLYWRGLWTVMDLHHQLFPAHGCFFLGMGIHTIFAILKYAIHAKFAKELQAVSVFGRFGYRLLRILYTYVFATGCIMHWRGGWIIFDNCTTSYEWFSRFSTLGCLLILILLRCVRNLVAPPYIVVIDKRGYSFKFPTRFNLNTTDWSLYILDCAFSVGVVGTLVVFVWRGVWVIFDLYLFPDNAEYSAVSSIVIGYTIVVITFSLQPVMRYACTRLKGLSRLVVADMFLLLSFAGTINVWRGVWNVFGLWLLPEDPEVSCWITHLGCFTFLVLLNCSNSILVRGVCVDAEEAGGKCVVFPCHYLRLFFKIEREKKEARRQNLVVAPRDLATITERTEKEENGALLNTSNAPIVADNPESLV